MTMRFASTLATSVIDHIPLPGTAPTPGSKDLLFLLLHQQSVISAKVVCLILLQKFPAFWRVFRSAQRRLRARRLQCSSDDEVVSLQDAVKHGRLCCDVVVQGQLIRAGTEVFISARRLARGAVPLKLRWHEVAKSDKSDGSRTGRRSEYFREMLAIFKCGKLPFLLWGWGSVLLDGVNWLLHQSFPMWLKKDLRPARAVLVQIDFALLCTAVALLAHRLLARWHKKSRQEDGVMGWESSLHRAQTNALVVSFQVAVWTLSTCSVLWSCGLEVGHILFFPSATAVFFGWIGREVVANLIAGVMLNVTQPFAQGDWVTVQDASIDGWVQSTGTFYTRVVQWDKRPVYIPNVKLMTMNVTNNSRMTHRRILYELPLRLKDIPKIPQIVQDMQEMINEHEDIDVVQHRLVRWRSIGTYSANIFLSCYTHPTADGIRLATFCSVQQSILERCSQIVYKHAAQFASETDRYQAESEGLDGIGLTKLFDSFNSSTTGREEQLEAREQVLRQRERELKERERSAEAEAEKLAQKSSIIKKAESMMQELVETQDLPTAGMNEGALDSEGLQQISSTTAADSRVSEVAAPEAQMLQTASAAAAAAAEFSQNDQDEEMQKSTEPSMPAAVEAISPLVGNEDIASGWHASTSASQAEHLHATRVPELDSDDGCEVLEGICIDEEVLDEELPPKPCHDGERLHTKQAEDIRIPVKEMGD